MTTIHDQTNKCSFTKAARANTHSWKQIMLNINVGNRSPSSKTSRCLSTTSSALLAPLCSYADKKRRSNNTKIGEKCMKQKKRKIENWKSRLRCDSSLFYRLSTLRPQRRLRDGWNRSAATESRPSPKLRQLLRSMNPQREEQEIMMH